MRSNQLRLHQIDSRGCSVLRPSSMEENEREEERSSNRATTTQLWSWGAGTDGQLATATLEDSHLPLRLSLLSQHLVTHLACGGAHVIALTGQDGRVLSWGRGTSGQLGHGDLQNCLYPKPVKSLESLVITHVSAGWNHSGFVSESGRVFTCGDGSFGQLGHGVYNTQSLPTEIQCLGSNHVDQIACGMRHSLVLLKGPLSDPIFGFGSAKRGQLGVPKDRIMKSFNFPQVVSGFEDVEVVSIIANGDHSAALTADGHLYTWGRGFCGSSDVYVPLLFSSPLRFTRVALGWNHALVLTDEEEVFMLGGNHHGLLNDSQTVSQVQSSHNQGTLLQGSDGDGGMLALRKVPGLNGTKVVDIAAGSEHSVLVTVDGKIEAWGWGEHGQLGLGDVCDHTSPQIVTLGDRNYHSQLHVYCGSGFSYIVGRS